MNWFPLISRRRHNTIVKDLNDRLVERTEGHMRVLVPIETEMRRLRSLCKAQEAQMAKLRQHNENIESVSGAGVRAYCTMVRMETTSTHAEKE